MPDSVPQAIINWFTEQGWQFRHSQTLGGGCVAQVARLSVVAADGRQAQWLLKTAATGAEGEAAGLRALAQAGALAVPRVFFVDNACLLMEFMPQVPRGADFDERLGRGLALQHRCRAERFGFEQTTFCGGTPQNNTWQSDGCRFFTEQRLLALGSQCRDSGRLSRTDLQRLERFCLRLPEQVPEQPAVLLHGDLWHGNVITTAAAEPALIDPAVYYGWAEADLAMTLMFGGFSERFYGAYRDLEPVAPGWRKRADIYNLYHYLNHLLLFGGGYHSDVLRIVKYY